MGVSEVLLCPYRCLEYKMVRLEKLKIHGSTPSLPSPPLPFNFDIVTSVLLLSNCLYLHILGLMIKYDVYPLLIYLQLGLCGVVILGVVIVGRSVRIVSRLLFVYIRSLLI